MQKLGVELERLCMVDRGQVVWGGGGGVVCVCGGRGH